MVYNPDNPNEHDDPLAAASNATLRPREYYGEVDIDAWFCALIKGQGKVPYDPVAHKDLNRCTAVDLTVTPIAEMNLQFALQRSMIAESREWAGIVWPSAKELGITSVRDLKGKWVKVIQAPTGRKYRGNDGTEREATTVKFLAVYGSVDECLAAYYAETGAEPDIADVDDEPIPGFEPADAGNGQNGMETARPFIHAYAKVNGYDVEKTREACRAQTVITNAIDVDSDEFVEIVGEAMSA